MASRKSPPQTPSPPQAQSPLETPTALLGRTVRAQRKRLGLTQEDLAIHAGVGLAFLYQLETGKRTVRLDKVLAVFEVLGIAVTLSLGQPGRPAGSIRSDIPGTPS